MTFRDLNHDHPDEQDEEESEEEGDDDFQSPIEEEHTISAQPVELPKLELDLFDLNLGGNSIMSDINKEFDKALDAKKVIYETPSL